MDTPAEPRTPESVRGLSIVSAVLVVILFVELIAGGAYAISRVRRMADPAVVADRVEETIRTNYPELRRELLTRVERRAPRVADEVSEQIRASIPDGREALERFTARQIARGLDELTELSADEFRELLRSNREQIIPVFETIEAAPQEFETAVHNLEQSIEQQLAVDLQRQTERALELHHQLNARLEVLAGPPESLDARGQLERRMVRILRAM